MNTIQGTVIRGNGAASNTLKKQFPLLKSYIPDIETFHRGTINLQLDQPLMVTHFDVQTPRLCWHPDHTEEKGNGERFRLLRVQFQAMNVLRWNAVTAWFYYAHRSGHRTNPFLVEVIAPHVELKDVTRCAIHFNQQCREVPHPSWFVVDGSLTQANESAYKLQT